jgi:hypothetical protein
MPYFQRLLCFEPHRRPFHTIWLRSLFKCQLGEDTGFKSKNCSLVIAQFFCHNSSPASRQVCRPGAEQADKLVGLVGISVWLEVLKNNKKLVFLKLKDNLFYFKNQAILCYFAILFFLAFWSHWNSDQADKFVSLVLSKPTSLSA